MVCTFWTSSSSWEGSYKIGSVHPSIHPSVCPGIGIVSLVFSKFLHGARNLYDVLHGRAGFSGKKFFATKTGKMDQEWVKNRVFWIYWKILVINFYWICSLVKIHIICCVPAQIPYLQKFLFLRYSLKCSQPVRLQEFLINHISRTNQWNNMIFCMLIQIHIN